MTGPSQHMHIHEYDTQTSLNYQETQDITLPPTSRNNKTSNPKLVTVNIHSKKTQKLNRTTVEKQGMKKT